MRNPRVGTALVGVLCVPLAGCDALLDFLGPSTVTVLLVNENETFAVEATVTYDDVQEVPEAVLLETGEQSEFTVGAGDSVMFTRDCDDLQAIILEDADLLVIGGTGPETSSDVQRDGSDFSCGDTLVFTFSGGLTDFDVAFSTQ